MPELTEHFEKALRAKRAELARAIRTQSSQLTISEGESELTDRMQGMTRREEAITFLDTMTRTLMDVEAALLAVKEGSYGTCSECGEPIATKRLHAVPWASRCLGCQEMLDQHGHTLFGVPSWGNAA